MRLSCSIANISQKLDPLLLRRSKVNLVNIVRFLAALSWLAVFAVIALVVLRASRGQKLRSANLIVISVAVFAIVVNVAAAGLVFIQPTERGVVVTIAENGIRDAALQPGLNWVIPYAETVVPYSISDTTYTMSIAPQEGQLVGDDSVEARTSDGQIVLVDASVIFSVDPTEVVDLHIRWQDRYVDGLVRPIARGAIRAAVAQFQIDEVYSLKRAEMAELIRMELDEKFDSNRNHYATLGRLNKHQTSCCHIHHNGKNCDTNHNKICAAQFLPT